MNLRLETAKRLLARARDDRFVVASLAGDSAAPLWPVGFHAQQAIEKGLKAVLAARGVEYPLTHNLALLLTELTHAGCGSPPDASRLPELTPYGVAFRYGDFGDSDEVRMDPAWALACVDRTIAWCESQV